MTLIGRNISSSLRSLVLFWW